LETRREIFDRVNTSGMKARPSEIRRGAHQSAFMKFIGECAHNSLFRDLCPISKGLRLRYEDEELVLRFFAYSDSYRKFRHGVEPFLTEFVKQRERGFARRRFETEFKRMLDFVRSYFPYGFAKTPTSRSTPRVRFEAISVGVNLALRKDSDLVPRNPRRWLESAAFDQQTTTHASNSQPRLRGRIEFVRDHLLDGAP
jgi:hypothetical protein